MIRKLFRTFDQSKLAFVQPVLRRTHFEVITKSHGHTVGTGVHHSQSIAGLRPMELPILAQEVRGLADRSDNIEGRAIANLRCSQEDMLISVV